MHGYMPTGFAWSTPCTFLPDTNSRRALPNPSPLQVLIDAQRCRNINLPSIDYAFRPRLRVRLTLGGMTYPRKP